MWRRTFPGSDPRPLRDRAWFKPLAVLMLLPVIAVSALLMAVFIAPPFTGAALGVKSMDARIAALGEDFRGIPRFPQRSTIYANDGETPLATIYINNRKIVRLKNVSIPVRKAVMAIEDSGFYDHGALDWSSLVRAVIENVRAGNVVQGASTITQQLVKNTLGEVYDRSLDRKIQELAIAMRVEAQYSKDEILEMYLNQVYLGNGVYGVGTAARFYFHKPAKDLNLAEGAMLAGMIRAPNTYNPLKDPEAMLLRRNDVLNRMIGLGDDWFPVERVRHAKELPLGLAKGVHPLKQRQQPFFVKYMIEQVLSNASGAYDSLGRTSKARRRALFEGGLKIVTTFDPSWQRFAQEAADRPLARTVYPPPGKAPPDVSIVSVDSATGGIRTMLSGRNYRKQQLNLATSPHATGSSFKPFVLATAFEQGISPEDSFDSSSPWCGVEWDPTGQHCVANAEGGGSGMMSLRSATTHSVNVVFAHLIVEVGPENVVEAAQRMGITADLPPVNSLATGSAEVSPLDMASGFATLANGGIHCAPFTIQTITRGAKTLFDHQPDCQQVLDPGIAATINGMLETVPSYGTAAGAFYGWGAWPIAGKTGTADLNKNVWYVGYTRQVSTAVWVGPPGELYSMGSVFGGTLAAPIWRDYMGHVMEGQPALGFPSGAAIAAAGTVPKVVGKTQEEATAELQAAGFLVQVSTVDSTERAGRVVAQFPDVGAPAEAGGTVSIEVSNGVPPAVSVPSVLGLTRAAATAALERKGFTVRIEKQAVQAEEKVGRVVRQEPGPDAAVDPGSEVVLFVGARS